MKNSKAYMTLPSPSQTGFHGKFPVNMGCIFTAVKMLLLIFFFISLWRSVLKDKIEMVRLVRVS